MSKVDTSIPYEELCMVNPQPECLQLLELPPGFHHADHVYSFEKQWCSLMTSLNFFPSEKEAAAYWNQMKEKDQKFLAENFHFLLENETDRLAAVCGIWYGRSMKHIPYRIHYLGVDESFQNRGLARYILHYTVCTFARNHPGPLYLSTQSQSWPAVLLYLKSGFMPWTNETLHHSARENTDAWNRADQFIFTHIHRHILTDPRLHNIRDI